MGVTASTKFVCQQCGASFLRWSGQCTSCKSWNSIVEEAPVAKTPGTGKVFSSSSKKKSTASNVDAILLDGSFEPPQRFSSRIHEFDRVLGGGFVPGSATLLGGEPGVGKSTLLLQIACLSDEKTSTLYISGEEAIDQIALRSQRIRSQSSPTLRCASALNVSDIIALTQKHQPKLLIIDSVQTMYVEGIESAPGTVSQVRAVAQVLLQLCKNSGCAVVMIGHMTKDGSLAGPRVLEHMVDTVLHIEGERGHPFRILRSSKNRFGATNEIGVFDMTEQGLKEVSNPSELFLSSRKENVAGAAIFAGIEGTRPVLVEIQALVAPSPFAAPRRSAVGWDHNRLNMIIAILETRGGYAFAASDIYLNVVGGMRVSETAVDLAAGAALVSSLIDKPIPEDTVIFGEMGLTGEVRPVSHMETRLKEAAKLGFKKAVIPKQSGHIKQSIDITHAQDVQIYHTLLR